MENFGFLLKILKKFRKTNQAQSVVHSLKELQVDYHKAMCSKAITKWFLTTTQQNFWHKFETNFWRNFNANSLQLLYTEVLLVNVWKLSENPWCFHDGTSGLGPNYDNYRWNCALDIKTSAVFYRLNSSLLYAVSPHGLKMH